MNIRFIFVAAVLTAINLGSEASAFGRDADWIDNTHGAPLLIVGKEHTLTVKNRSQKTVQSYRLGCLRSDPHSVVHRFPLEKTQIAPSTGNMVATFDAPPEEQVTCQKLRARVSVLEVTFTDGTKWQLANTPHSSHDSPAKK